VRREVPSFIFDTAADREAAAARARLLESSRDRARVMELEHQLEQQNLQSVRLTVEMDNLR
jgi:hypothetical protein